MKFEGTVAFAAAQTAVWHILTTPTLVSQCTPRLEGWTPLENNKQFQLQFCWGSGSSTIHIPFLLTWQIVTPPDYLKWHGEIKMGETAVPVQGYFQLCNNNEDPAKQTTLTFSADISPHNKLLAQMIQTTLPRLMNSFFHCLKKTAEAS